MTTAKLNAKKLLLPAAGILLVLLLLIAWLRPGLSAPKLPPAELAAVAVDNLLAAESFCFHSESRLSLNEESTPLGELSGELCGVDLHVQGNVLATPVNIYQIGETTYRQDALSEQWLEIADGELLQNDSLLYDVDPRAFFDLAAIENAAEAGEETIDEEKCWKLTFTPRTKSGYYEKYFDSLACTLWITRDDRQIRQAAITAAAHAGEQQSELSVTTEFWGWNETPPIEAPIVTNQTEKQPEA